MVHLVQRALILSALAVAALVCGQTVVGAQGAPTGAVVWYGGGRAVVETLEGARARELPARSQTSFRLAPDGRSLAIVDRSVRLVDLASGRSQEVLPAGSVTGTLGSAVFSANGRFVAVSFGDEHCKRLPGIVVVDLETLRQTRPRLWPRAKPWRYGASTRFVDVLAVTNNGLVAFHESRYTFGECRYQELSSETVWRITAPSADPARIISDAEIGEVAWSADDDEFAYTIGAGDECELWVGDGRGRNARRVAVRDYVRFGCSRGISGIPIVWNPDGTVLYYADGSEVWTWDRSSGRHRALVRPPGAPSGDCESSQSCLNHDFADLSADGQWLLLVQEKRMSTYRETLFLISTRTGAARIVKPPAPGLDPETARLD